VPLPSGTKTPLTMTVCQETSKGKLKRQTGSGQSIALLINPAQLKLSRSVSLKKITPLGGVGQGQKFNQMPPSDLSFSVVFDGTGVVPKPAGSTLPDDVEEQLEALLKVIYVYAGDKHEPNIVQVVWGSLLFVGRLTSFVTDYTLFKPNGHPLRATAALAFSSYMSIEEAKLEANASSPDLSHVVEVRAGDTLPLLCQRIYGDGRYYPAVARFNRLSSFRVLRPGMHLHFPPLE
jgi:hypothetical protein